PPGPPGRPVAQPTQPRRRLRRPQPPRRRRAAVAARAWRPGPPRRRVPRDLDPPLLPGVRLLRTRPGRVPAREVRRGRAGGPASGRPDRAAGARAPEATLLCLPAPAVLLPARPDRAGARRPPAGPGGVR